MPSVNEFVNVFFPNASGVKKIRELVLKVIFMRTFSSISYMHIFAVILYTGKQHVHPLVNVNKRKSDKIENI